jgi:hypothetical protein
LCPRTVEGALAGAAFIAVDAAHTVVAVAKAKQGVVILARTGCDQQVSSFRVEGRGAAQRTFGRERGTVWLA